MGGCIIVIRGLISYLTIQWQPKINVNSIIRWTRPEGGQGHSNLYSWINACLVFLHPNVKSWVNDLCKNLTSCVKVQAFLLKFTVFLLTGDYTRHVRLMCNFEHICWSQMKTNTHIELNSFYQDVSLHVLFCQSGALVIIPNFAAFLQISSSCCASSCGAAVSFNTTPTLAMNWDRALL